MRRVRGTCPPACILNAANRYKFGLKGSVRTQCYTLAYYHKSSRCRDIWSAGYIEMLSHEGVLGTCNGRSGSPSNILYHSICRHRCSAAFAFHFTRIHVCFATCLFQWYEEAFEELKTVSNIDDLDRLVTVFMKQEDEHFSLFNYIQTVNQETDQHLEKTEELEV